MSSLTKKKHVYNETTNNFELPTPNQMIVKVKAPRGNNLHDVETPNKEEFIVTMPQKFRKTVWVKRGDYLIVQPIDEGNKVKAEIIQILDRDHIRYLKEQNVWPSEFNIETTNSNTTHGIDNDLLPPSESDDDDDDALDDNNENIEPVNMNRSALFNVKNINNLNVNNKNS